ncbi:F234A protein, partial [Centropus bengalensis]|nr:F234A protein [Centropus bengalensis]
TEKTLYAYSLKGLYSAAMGVEMKFSGLEEFPQWEKSVDQNTEHVSLHSTADIRYLSKVPGRLRENILLVTSEGAALVNPHNIQILWTLNVSQVLSEPLVGYYRPDVLGIVFESEIGPNRKKV